MTTRRASTEARGYGKAHRTERARWARILKRAGVVDCARCGLPIYATWPVNPPAVHVPACPARPDCQGGCWCTWDLGHTDDRTAWTGPEHTSCNRAAGARNSRKARKATPAPRAYAPGRDYGW